MWLRWVALVPLALLSGFGMSDRGEALIGSALARAHGGYTVEERVAQYGALVRTRVAGAFAAANIDYPPKRLAFVAFKDERVLEVYSRASADSAWQRVLSYPILGMSGGLGPKTRQGDLQVPEGVYRSEFLNANSRYHLSIRVNYPNADDRAVAAAEQRDNLGGDIMIHGTTASIGCLAMGNDVAEDLFVLAAGATAESLPIVIAPVDFRVREYAPPEGAPAWWTRRYEAIQAALRQFPIPQ